MGKGKIKIHVITDLHMKNIDGDEHHKAAIGEQGLFYSIPENFRNYAKAVNKEEPDFVLALGDCIHGSCPPKNFMEIWESIQAPKALIPGNHDLDIYAQMELAKHFGYADANVTAGSPFQQAIVIKKETISCRILMLDTSYTSKNQSSNHWQKCRMHDATLAWIGQQLEENKEDYVLLCSHVSPHHYDVKDFYEEKQAKKIQSLVGNYIERHPDVKVLNFAGHAHPEEPVQVNTFGTDFPAIIFPSMIRQREIPPTGGPDGVYSIVTLEPDDLQVSMKWIKYH